MVQSPLYGSVHKLDACMWKYMAGMYRRQLDQLYGATKIIVAWL